MKNVVLPITAVAIVKFNLHLETYTDPYCGKDLRYSISKVHISSYGSVKKVTYNLPYSSTLYPVTNFKVA